MTMAERAVVGPHLSRFERELADLHGDGIVVETEAEFVDVGSHSYWSAAPTRAKPLCQTRAEKWWDKQPRMEKVWLAWLWSVCAMVGTGVGVIAAIILSTLVS